MLGSDAWTCWAVGAGKTLASVWKADDVPMIEQGHLERRLE
jgi:hypothetical protein